MSLNIPVSDPFCISEDPEMAFLAPALDPSEVKNRMKQRLFSSHDKQMDISIAAIRVVRHKPGRRCLIEYDLLVGQHDSPEVMTLIGKVRARGLDAATYRLQTALVKNGFGRGSRDGISVPEAVGVIPEYRMWLQRKVPGILSTRLLAEDGGIALAKRIAEAAYKLHSAGIAPRRSHTVHDEIRILHKCLGPVGIENPHWAQRISRLLDACRLWGAAAPASETRGIHRDFYPDQVIVDGDRLYILDLDLYCEGDPGLDIGNFLAHLKEQGLRTMGDAEAMTRIEEAIKERFLQLAGRRFRNSIEMYETLTLVRHIYLSTQFHDRQSFTEPLLDLCEQRLGKWLKGSR